MNGIIDVRARASSRLSCELLSNHIVWQEIVQLISEHRGTTRLEHDHRNTGLDVRFEDANTSLE